MDTKKIFPFDEYTMKSENSHIQTNFKLGQNHSFGHLKSVFNDFGCCSKFDISFLNMSDVRPERD